MCRIALIAFAVFNFAPRPCAAQNAATAPDTFVDDGARVLVLNALTLRDSAAAGLRSYEARVTERVRVGIAITKRLPNRSRTLYHREQVAHVRWQSDGANRLRWLGRRTGTPTVGDDWADRAPFGLGFDIADELSLSDIGVDLLFDPFGDRLDVFEADLVQPLSAEGLGLYRFASGDTMQIRLPAPDRTITLVEVVVAPRSKTWEAVEGSLWFDRDTGVLVRAAYRPSGVWDHEVQEPGDFDDLPGFLKPAIGTVRSIVIEYGLYERRWWLPRRIFADGEFDWGNGLVRMPLTVEWAMSDHVVNEVPGGMVTDPELVVTGRGRRGDDDRRETIEYLALPGVDLSQSPDLAPPPSDGEPVAFTRAEIASLTHRIEAAAGPAPGPGGPSLRRAALTSFRYDRVRGLNAAWTTYLDAGGFRLVPRIRLATAIPDVEPELEVWRGRAFASVYRRVDDASDWNVADGIGNSLGTLFLGLDGGDYYRVLGGEVGVRVGRPSLHATAALFAEAQRPIARQTSVSLSRISRDSLRANLRAQAVDVAGVRAVLGGQLGSDPQRGILDWTLAVEAARGERDWVRALPSIALTGPLTHGLTAAIELRGGITGRDAPVQRTFLLGGAGSLRGVRENAIAGRTFWLARAEIGKGLPGLRAIAFLDIGNASEPDALGDSLGAGTGLGASFMDGLFRVDLARGLADAAAWRFYFYLNALL